MRKHVCTLVMAGLVVAMAGLGLSNANAQEEAAASADPQMITQGEVAVQLAQRLYGKKMSVAESIANLLADKISPAAGWQPNAQLVVGDFARILVQAWNLAYLIPAADVDNPQAYVDLLQAEGIPIEDTVAMAQLKMAAESTGLGVDSELVNSDPLKVTEVYTATDRSTTGTDVGIAVTPTPRVGGPLPVAAPVPLVQQPVPAVAATQVIRRRELVSPTVRPSPVTPD